MGKTPSYAQITQSDLESLESDASAVEKAEEFELAYNFRFEDPNASQLVTHSREIASSVRRKDDRRKKQREARKDRKEQEKEEKRQELKRLKNLKKMEIIEKLQKIKEITGSKSMLLPVLFA